MAKSSSVPAKPSERIKGSKKNKPGSAQAKNARKIKFSKKTETALRNKMQEHNKKASAGRKATMGQLKAVYRRGAGAFSTSHRPGKTRDQWAMARVNAYLKLLRSGKPSNKNYVQDNDLLPATHPRSSKKDASIIADGRRPVYHELFVELLDESEYESPEDAIVAMAEYSGFGYEFIPSVRAAWKRALANDENPFDRARDLVTLLGYSRDRDLLPRYTDEAES